MKAGELMTTLREWICNIGRDNPPDGVLHGYGAFLRHERRNVKDTEARIRVLEARAGLSTIRVKVRKHR